MPLRQGEKVEAYVMGDAFNSSANVFIRIASFIQRVIYAILGMSMKVHLFVTNYRLIVINYQKLFWFFDNSIDATSVSPRAIQEFGYRRLRSLILFKTHYLNIGEVCIKAYGGREAVYKMVDTLSEMAELYQKKNILSVGKKEKKSGQPQQQAIQ